MSNIPPVAKLLDLTGRTVIVTGDASRPATSLNPGRSLAGSLTPRHCSTSRFIASGQTISRGAKLSIVSQIFDHALVPETCVARNSPVETSRNAAAKLSPSPHSAARYTDSFASSSCGSIAVPGVITRTTSRLTSFVPRPAGSACSQIATR